jgi:hypothetical protein
MSHWPGFWEIGRSKPRSKLAQILLCSESTHGMLTGQIRTIVPGKHQNQQRFILLRSNCEQLRVNPDFGKFIDRIYKIGRS